MRLDAPERMQRLAARVRWSDRLRRPIAIVIALVLGPLLVFEFRAATGGGWPVSAALLPMVMATVVIWWSLEACVALMTALWETEYDRIARGFGIPTARLVRRRRWPWSW
jgi:hypothetical protein